MATKPHAFVAMPFGIKPGPDGTSIDFNRVYAEYIAPALAKAGLEAFRADGEIRAGDIRTDMFQELLVADLVIADLTTPNPNVWYELGVRHALRARCCAGMWWCGHHRLRPVYGSQAALWRQGWRARSRHRAAGHRRSGDDDLEHHGVLAWPQDQPSL
ncbi:MAG: hypothetical protein FJY37_02275 [Betaproteobacteria bacterium]|nr:hypothetical protein [Betaproteobacteria bacterium]